MGMEKRKVNTNMTMHGGQARCAMMRHYYGTYIARVLRKLRRQAEEEKIICRDIGT